jgi:hypothetical protein
MIGEIIGRNEIVPGHCGRPDIETRHLSQRDERRRITRRFGAGLQTALIDAIACQIRFTVVLPSQRGTPRSTRPQHKNTSDGSCPVHTVTSIAFSPAAGTPLPEKPIPHVQESMPDCSADSSSEVSSKRGTIHPLTVAARQGMCRRRRRRVRTKTLNMSRGDRKIDGDVQGDCRRLWQIAESNVVFLGG